MDVVFTSYKVCFIVSTDLNVHSFCDKTPKSLPNIGIDQTMGPNQPEGLYLRAPRGERSDQILISCAIGVQSVHREIAKVREEVLGGS
jgi:hypothetical protein